MRMENEAGKASRTFGTGAIIAVAVVSAVLGGALGFLASGGGAKESARPSLQPAPPPPSLAPLVHLELGQTGVTETGGQVTVLTWDTGHPAYWPPPPQGFRYSRAEVRFCTGEGVWNFRVREIPYLFNLVDSAGQLLPPFVDIRHSTDELASYNLRLITANRCMTGSVIFQQPVGAHIVGVRFTGHGRFQWDVSAISDGSSPAPSPAYEPGESLLHPESPTPALVSPPLSPSEPGSPTP
jgi:hypothetical protein